jgi:EpsD family peptidyl-prolyl cis-trans isomerase
MTRDAMKIRHVPLIAAAALSAALSACEQPTTASMEKVAATVGGEIISETELNRAVSRLGALNESESAHARGKVLEALIDQQLVSNAAKGAKLDKDPEVALAMQQAQRQVLVEAYMERMFKNMAKPSDTEINDYYIRHPELFAARRIYRIQELELPMPSARLPEVEARLKQSHSLSEFADWLRAQGIDGKAGLVVKPAEQLPAAILAQMKNMQDGQLTVLATGPGRISVLQLQGSQTQPVTLEQARGAIEQVLLSDRRKIVLETEIRKLRSSGKIEYASGFAPAMPGRQAEKSSGQAIQP